MSGNIYVTNIPRLGMRPRVLGISNILRYAPIYIFLAFIYLSISSCTTYAVNPDLPCPDRPVLTAIPEDLQLRMPEDAVFIVAENQLLLKTHIKKLEVRAGCGD